MGISITGLLTLKAQTETPSSEGLSQQLKACLVWQEGCQSHTSHVQISSMLLHMGLAFAHSQQLRHLPHIWTPGVRVGVQKGLLLAGQDLQTCTPCAEERAFW